jgi:hypothetical protein
MKNLNPRIERLKQMMVLEEKRAALQGELDSISQQLSALEKRLPDEGGRIAAPAAKAAGVARKIVKRQKRGLLKDKIMAALHAAGSPGVKVKELAVALGTKPVNIHSWFHSALKRKAPIKKITGGHYRLDSKGAAAATPAAKPAKAAAPAAKGKPRRGAKRGQLTAKILAALKVAGSGGITVADLSDKLGAKYKNIYIWFATTGKKNPNVKKLGPAKYKLAA